MIITCERVLKADQGEISVDPDILDRFVKAVLDERNVSFCRIKCVRIYYKFIATVKIAFLVCQDTKIQSTAPKSFCYSCCL